MRMGRKCWLEGRVWEGKEGLKEEYGKEKEDFTEDNGKERKVLRKIMGRKSMGRKGRFEGK